MTWIAESRIRDAIARGELDALPGRGEPLPPDEAMNVPDDLRMAYRIMKNAGYLTTKLETLSERLGLGDLLRACDPEGGCAGLRQRISLHHELAAIEQRSGPRVPGISSNPAGRRRRTGTDLPGCERRGTCN